HDRDCGIPLHAAGNAYVVSFTNSANCPTTVGAFQPALAGNFDSTVTKLNSTGSSLVYSTYLGGSGGDFGGPIAVDATGNAYVTGSTNSSNFPTTFGAFQPTLAGGADAFVTRTNPTGPALI